MSEEVNVEQTAEEVQLQAIEELKLQMESMVAGEEHEKLKAEYKKLMNDYVNKRTPVKPPVKELRKASEIAQELKQINDGDVSNRAYIEKSVEYRNAYIHEFGTDPWTDFSVNGSGEPTAKTKALAAAYQQLLDDNPSPVEFRMKFQSLMKDDPQVMAALKSRNKKNRK